MSKSHEVDLEQERQKFEALGREVAELQSRILQADKMFENSINGPILLGFLPTKCAEKD